MAPLLTLLTDFGLSDYYVAAVKGTVLRLAAGTQVVDISHEVEPGNVVRAAFLLGAAAPSFPAGTVHLVVVDPGVGTSRRIVAAEAGGFLLLGPDNGVLTPLLDGATIRSVERDDLFLPGPSATFHGRDRFAPVAAFLLRGGRAEELGPVISDAVMLEGARSRRETGLLSGTVIHIDRFGNLVTDIPASWLPPAAAAAAGGEPLPVSPPAIVARVGSHTASRLAANYTQIPRHEAAVMVGSSGTLELALQGENLARRWGVATGAPVQVRWQ
jgi:S-adenosylmethionine hydrolase